MQTYKLYYMTRSGWFRYGYNTSFSHLLNKARNNRNGLTWEIVTRKHGRDVVIAQSRGGAS